jgi:hypothetical protein
MTVAVLDGQVTVTEQGVSVTVPAGARAIIPLDENGLGAGAPRLEGYDTAELAVLPIEILPEVITIAPGLSAEALNIELPAQATWHMVMASGVVTCGPNYAVDFGGTDEVVVSVDEGGVSFYNVTLTATGLNTYSADAASVPLIENGQTVGSWFYRWTVQVNSSTQMTGTLESIGDCTSDGIIAFTMTR